MAHDVFISHSSKDKSIADAVCSILEQNKIRCWIAPRDVTPGRAYAGCITEAIKLSKVLVIIFSSNSNASGPVTNELEIAMRNNITIIPFRIEDIILSNELEYYLASRHWLDAITPPIEQHINTLAEKIKSFVYTNVNKVEAKFVEKKDKAEEAIQQEDEQAWKKACSVNTISAYEGYINRTAMKKHEVEAAKYIRNLAAKEEEFDAVEWEKAVKENTVEAFKGYLEGKTIKKHGEEAEQNIRQLQQLKEADKKEWDKALNINTIEAYNNYLNSNNLKIFKEEALKNIEKITIQQNDDKAWEKAVLENTIEALKNYLEGNTVKNYKADAEKKLLEMQKLMNEDKEAWEVATKENTVEAYLKYLNSNKLTSFKNIAIKNIDDLKNRIEAAKLNDDIKKDQEAWEKAQNEYSIESYQNYINGDTRRMHKQLAVRKIKELNTKIAEDKEAWDKARKENTIESYKTYIKGNTLKKYLKQAEDNILKFSVNSGNRKNKGNGISLSISIILIGIAFRNYLIDYQWSILKTILWSLLILILTCGCKEPKEIKDYKRSKLVYCRIIQYLLPTLFVILSWKYIQGFWIFDNIIMYKNLIIICVSFLILKEIILRFDEYISEVCLFKGYSVGNRAITSTSSIIAIMILYFIYNYYSKDSKNGLVGLIIWIVITCIFCIIIPGLYNILIKDFSDKTRYILSGLLKNSIPIIGLINIKYSPISFLHGWWLVYIIGIMTYFILLIIILFTE